MKRWLAKMAVAVAMAAAAGGAQAQCAGFTDVTDDGTVPGAFCPNVQWLKNRAITLGCTSTTLYCPTMAVSRLAMAAFMNRLGKALTPEVLQRQVTFGANAIPGPAPASPLIRCISADTAAATYPRQVVVNGSLTGLADGNTAGFNVFLLVSTDSGATYAQFDPLNSVGQRATAAPNSWAGAAVTEQLDLALNTTYLFALGVRRDAIGPATIGEFAAGRCQLTATIFNRNPTSAPFDEQ
jgi:hypothetical protein